LLNIELFELVLSADKHRIHMTFDKETFHFKRHRVTCQIAFHRLLPVQIFFKQWRHMDASKRPTPVMVHVNYHPNKEERMDTIIQYFRGGDAGPMMKLPGGSEAGT
jgi:hypothetical protein